MKNTPHSADVGARLRGRSVASARQKGAYKVDLRGLHALCEANYIRLIRLFPDYESSNQRRFMLQAAHVHIEVLERSRYTTLFQLRSFRPSGPASDSTGQGPNAEPNNHSAPSNGKEPTDDNGSEVHTGWLAPLRLEARAYHDAGMLEVVGFQKARRAEGRYDYPNPAMHQQDEKNQQNTFLADWLAHCLSHGEADIAPLLDSELQPELKAGLRPHLRPGTEPA